METTRYSTPTCCVPEAFEGASLRLEDQRPRVGMELQHASCRWQMENVPAQKDVERTLTLVAVPYTDGGVAARGSKHSPVIAEADLENKSTMGNLSVHTHLLQVQSQPSPCHTGTSSRETHLVYGAFVGCNHTHTLAVVNPPNHHRIVRRAARKAITVRVEVDAEHAVRMACALEER
jgi:hypothetical protein